MSLVAIRTRQLADATGSSIGRTERVAWERNEAWQLAREAVEKLLYAYDWAECFTAMNLVLRPTLDHILLRQLATAAQGNGDDLTWLLLGNLAAHADRCARWSSALARYAIGQRAGNRDVLQRWVALADTSRRGRRGRAPARPGIAIRGWRGGGCGERRQLGPAPGTRRGGARGIRLLMPARDETWQVVMPAYDLSR